MWNYSKEEHRHQKNNWLRSIPIIDFLLNQKVQNEIGNTAFTSKVSHSDIQSEKTSTVAVDPRHLQVEVAG